LDRDLLWREGEALPPELRFAHAAMTTAMRAYGAGEPLKIETRSFQDDPGDKVGLGGSASTVVGVSAAVQHAADGAIDPQRLLPVALVAHQQAQGRAGSGYDVATCCLGGLLEWDRAAAVAHTLAWPSGLNLLAGFSGQSASTPAFIAKLNALRRLDPAAMNEQLEGLNVPVRRAADALRQGEITAALDALAEAHDALVSWDRRHALGIVTEPIQAMLKTAHALDVSAKISGAGGGDSVIALSTDADRLTQVRNQWANAGYYCLPISLDFSGVHAIQNGNA
jgi:phosphomevalonate kinase